MLQVSMASEVSLSGTSKFLAMGIFKIPFVLILWIQSVGIEKCDPTRAVMYTAGHSALCRCWICDTLARRYTLW
ncbi:hypothetical protein TNCV_919991 [Trichonephila clavipes]|nr:hypothetical protein TNCV_919991 [Trichonephila clavipes]